VVTENQGASSNHAAVGVDVAMTVEIVVEAEVNLKRKGTEQVC
jgi:hypothetical protein